MNLNQDGLNSITFQHWLDDIITQGASRPKQREEPLDWEDV